MNHLRDLMEACDGGVFSVVNSGNFSEEECHGLAEDVLSIGEKANCFWLGDIEGVLDLKTIEDLCRLPYDTCWFEGEAPGKAGLFIGMLCIQRSDQFHAAVFARHKNMWSFEGTIEAARFEDVKMAMRPADKSSEAICSFMMYAVKAFLSALHCSNVQRQEHAPSVKLQRARAKRGKAPLFSYWTLQLDGKSERGEHQGGTHASPRVHLRRGHPRQYAPGKWTRVQAHAVGNRAAGVIHKDYSAGPALSKALQQEAIPS